MDPESKKLLQDTLEIARENNQMLQSMRRSLRIQRLMSLVYWIFIIGSAFGAYYFIQPYLDDVIGVYGNTSDVLKSFSQ
jgi:predicted MFS family arabinose efflux permease